MKIEFEREPLPPRLMFGDLCLKDVFQVTGRGDEVFLKTPSFQSFNKDLMNCISLTTAEYRCFSSHILVVKLDATLFVKRV